jgi:hypothetical protein
MTQLSNQAQKIIDTFKHHIEELPVNERITAIKQMTEYLSVLNEEAKGIVRLFTSRNQTPPPNICDIEDIHDFK